MNRLLTCAAAFGAALLFAAPALAGGRNVVICPAGYATGFDARGQARCDAINALNAPGAAPVVASGNTGWLRPRILCPYPHRISDAVFSGGSGYVIKDDVRRANGCR